MSSEAQHGTEDEAQAWAEKLMDSVRAVLARHPGADPDAALQGAPVVTQDVDLWFEDLGDPGIREAFPVLEDALAVVEAARRGREPGEE
jgi:hypothetical protein